MIYRPDVPQIDREGQAQKYLYPGGERLRLDCHPRSCPLLGDPTTPLWLTEGLKKADALVSHGLCVLALMGVWCWRGTNEHGGKMVLPDWQHVAMNGREVRIVFDSDIIEKPAWRRRWLLSRSGLPANMPMSMWRIFPAPRGKNRRG